jgi:hypothetical protein
VSAEGIATADMARLLRRCAEAMDGEDAHRIAAGESMLHPVAGGPTVRGREICNRIAKEMGTLSWGEIAYYLLAYTWNDALTWADDRLA